MSNEVFNNSIGSPYSFDYPRLSTNQSKELIASLFEQLVLFDRITVSTSRVNFALFFLISQLGINTVEKLFEEDFLRFMIWSPLLMTGRGKRLENGTIDESTIYGKPPIAAGSLDGDDLDPERNIFQALQYFRLHRDRIRIFTKITTKQYLVPRGMHYSKEAAKLVIDSYERNDLADLGLPYVREPNQLHLYERQKLLRLGHSIIETALLAENNLKSFQNVEHFSICRQNLKNIGKAYNISENADVVFNLGGVPNLKQLYLTEKYNFEKVFEIRNISTAKHFRNWINSVGENATADDIRYELYKEITGSDKFFNSRKGKLVKNLGCLGVNSAIGAFLAGPEAAAAGFSFGLLESFWLESILKGKNPSMFIDEMKNKIEK